MIKIGVDPGRNTGIAIWSVPLKKFISLITGDFWDCIQTLRTYKNAGEPFEVVIEDPNLNRPVFPKGEGGMQQKLKIAQDVGRNKEDAYLIIEWCKRHKVKYRQVQPKDKKWTHATFNYMMKGISGQTIARTNEHVRDAARLVIGI